MAWDLDRAFVVPGPLQFQLQVSETKHPEGGDWENVGDPVIDQFFAVDTEQRDWSALPRTYYRVILTAQNQNYVSPPIGALGALDRRDWLLARQIIYEKKLELRLRQGALGYLLKPRQAGEPCPECLDFQTKTPTRTDCPSCYGTGFKCGYYYPIGCVWAGLMGRTDWPRLWPDGTRGQSNPTAVRAEMVLTGIIDTDDVWVNARTDDRYTITSIEKSVMIRGVPILGVVGLVPLPFSSPIYTIPVPQRLLPQIPDGLRPERHA